MIFSRGVAPLFLFSGSLIVFIRSHTLENSSVRSRASFGFGSVFIETGSRPLNLNPGPSYFLTLSENNVKLFHNNKSFPPEAFLYRVFCQKPVFTEFLRQEHVSSEFFTPGACLSGVFCQKPVFPEFSARSLYFRSFPPEACLSGVFHQEPVFPEFSARSLSLPSFPPGACLSGVFCQKPVFTEFLRQEHVSSEFFTPGACLSGVFCQKPVFPEFSARSLYFRR